MRRLAGILALLLASTIAYAQAAPAGPAKQPPPGSQTPTPAPSAPQSPRPGAPLPGQPAGPAAPIPNQPPARNAAPQGPIEISKEVKFKLFSNGINERTVANLIRSRFPGALDVKYKSEEKAICVKYEGTYSDLGRIEKLISDNVTLSAMVDPIRLVYNISAKERADVKALVAALEALKGIKKANVSGTSAELFLEAGTDLDPIETKADQNGYKFKLASHELVDISVEKPKEGYNDKPLREELLKMAGVIEVRLDSERLLVLALKGRVTRQGLKPLLHKHGLESK